MSASQLNNGITDKVSFFADPRRSNVLELYQDVDEISISPVITEMLNLVPNFFAVLNGNRQIISVNFSFLSFLGIENSADLLGLRLGEAIKCNYSDEMPAGCGTSKICSSCKMAMSIISALDDNKSEESYCTIITTKNGNIMEYFFSVKATRIFLSKKKYILIFLNEISEQQKKAYIENIFSRDINNLINLLNKNIKHLGEKPSELEFYCNKIIRITSLVNNELKYLKVLYNEQNSSYETSHDTVLIRQLFDGIKEILAEYKELSGKKLTINYPEDKIHLESDEVLVLRILIHMLLNGFEHCSPQSEVKLWVEKNEDYIEFKVWNDFYIPEEIAIRIFQKYFTTYDSIGRGIGTYFMKYFGENILGGKVDFSTSKIKGTTFSFILPSKKIPKN